MTLFRVELPHPRGRQRGGKREQQKSVPRNIVHRSSVTKSRAGVIIMAHAYDNIQKHVENEKQGQGLDRLSSTLAARLWCSGCVCVCVIALRRGRKRKLLDNRVGKADISGGSAK